MSWIQSCVPALCLIPNKTGPNCAPWQWQSHLHQKQQQQKSHLQQLRSETILNLRKYNPCVRSARLSRHLVAEKRVKGGIPGVVTEGLNWKKTDRYPVLFVGYRLESRWGWVCCGWRQGVCLSHSLIFFFFNFSLFFFPRCWLSRKSWRTNILIKPRS